MVAVAWWLGKRYVDPFSLEVSVQLRWHWFKKVGAERPWSGLELPAHSNTLALFAISVTTQVGNGEKTLFWTD
uniref:Uncharacterized protein n=1 Tax=Arundo donax TaxID=35708 RepID=A0A0A9HKJ6_ARUDO